MKMKLPRPVSEAISVFRRNKPKRDAEHSKQVAVAIAKVEQKIFAAAEKGYNSIEINYDAFPDSVQRDLCDLFRCAGYAVVIPDHPAFYMAPTRISWPEDRAKDD